MSGCAALVLASGGGVRLGAEVAKQYLDLAGRPVLRHSIETFLGHPAIDRVRCVIRAEDRALYDEAVAGLAILDPVSGGRDRQDSARLGLAKDWSARSSLVIPDSRSAPHPRLPRGR